MRLAATVDGMHRFVTRLLFLSLGAGELIGCDESAPLPPAKTAPQPFVALGETSPDIVADAAVASDLKTSTVPVSADQCRVACGALSTGCEVSIVVAGNPNRPSGLTGELHCHFPESSGGGGGWDPFHLNSCPFGCGRRPSSIQVFVRAQSGDALTDHVMDIALLEALSVAAFAQLERDLRRHAPRFLSRVARAKGDERRHARRARSVLRRLGGAKARVPRVELIDRDLTDAALDNAVEGCVHETFGAIVATLQARRAEDPSLRRFFESIAPDEIEHAALSWEVHDELWPKLAPCARAKIIDARLSALARIERMPVLSESVRLRVGAPSVDERRMLVRAMRNSLAALGAP
jgi:hypothetical protein